MKKFIIIVVFSLFLMILNSCSSYNFKSKKWCENVIQEIKGETSYQDLEFLEIKTLNNLDNLIQKKGTSLSATEVKKLNEIIQTNSESFSFKNPILLGQYNLRKNQKLLIIGDAHLSTSKSIDWNTNDSGWGFIYMILIHNDRLTHSILAEQKIKLTNSVLDNAHDQLEYLGDGHFKLLKVVVSGRKRKVEEISYFINEQGNIECQ